MRARRRSPRRRADAEELRRVVNADTSSRSATRTSIPTERATCSAREARTNPRQNWQLSQQAFVGDVARAKPAAHALFVAPLPVTALSRHCNHERDTAAKGVKRLHPIGREVRRGANGDLLYESDEHLKRDAPFPPCADCAHVAVRQPAAPVRAYRRVADPAQGTTPS